MKLSYIALTLLTFAVAAHATIYQCGSTFQGHPCAGATIRSGAPTTDDDQAAARISAFAAGQKKLYKGLEAKQQAKEEARAQIAAINLREQEQQQEQAARNAAIMESHHHYIQRPPINATNGEPLVGVGNGLAMGNNGNTYSNGGSGNLYTEVGH